MTTVRTTCHGPTGSRFAILNHRSDKLRNSEVLYCRCAKRVRIAQSGLRCFNNPSGNNLRYRIIAVIQFEDA